MILESIEEELQRRAGQEVPAVKRDLTVEHVLPQHWLAKWPLPVTDDEVAARAARDVAKHTIGNLLLITGRLNTEQSNSDWAKKRKLLNDRSTLLLSAEVRSEDHWDEGVIRARSERLAGVVTQLWRGPTDPHWS